MIVAAFAAISLAGLLSQTWGGIVFVLKRLKDVDPGATCAPFLLAIVANKKHIIGLWRGELYGLMSCPVLESWSATAGILHALGEPQLRKLLSSLATCPKQCIVSIVDCQGGYVDIQTGTAELLCEVNERVATVTLNRPHKKNSLSDQLTPALREILLELESRPDVGALLLTGAGDAFCSGGDVGGMSTRTVSDAPKKTVDEKVAELIRKQEALTLRLYEWSKPTIAALPGAAAGAGLSIALACDLRVASSSAFMVTAFRNIGLSGDYGSSWFLNRLLGQAKAKELMYLSERVDAAEGLRLGLINAIFDADVFRAEAFAYAHRLANGPTVALSRMKRNLNRGALQGLRESLAMEAEHVVMSFETEDAKEAVRAFVEKRKPEFKAR